MDTEGQRLFITPMKPEHLERLAQIESECFSRPWSYEGLAEELSNPLAVFLVAQRDGEIAGYVGMTAVIDEGYIANLAVTAAHRRQGVATALLQRLVDYAQEHNFRFLTLEVRPSNRPARRLYESFGFREAGRRKAFYSNPVEDGLILTRTF